MGQPFHRRCRYRFHGEGPYRGGRPSSHAGGHHAATRGAADLAINYYELEPGDSFAFAYHAHGIQEELFYIQQGTATFETGSGPVEAEAGEAIRFPPGEYQRGINRGEERVIALALGAPLEYGDTEKLRECPDCGDRTPQTLERSDDPDMVVARCQRCGEQTGRWA